MADDMMLRQDGTIALALVGRTITLRRPNLGEFRTLMEGFDELADRGTDALLEVADKQEELEKLTPEEQRAQRNELRHFRTEIARTLQRDRLEWIASAVKMLGNGELDPDDPELPAWILDSMIPNDMTRHWGNRPGPRSGEQ